LVTHGRSQMRDDLLERYPEGLVALCKVPGIGQALATRLYHDYDVRGLEALIQAAGAGRLVGVKGLGPKIMVKVLAGAEALLAEQAQAGAGGAATLESKSDAPEAPHPTPAEELSDAHATPPEEDARATAPDDAQELAEDQDRPRPATGAADAALSPANEASPARALDSEVRDESRAPRALAPGDLLRCPQCAGIGFELGASYAICQSCKRVYPVIQGVLRLTDAVAMDAAEKGRHGKGLWRVLRQRMEAHEGLGRRDGRRRRLHDEVVRLLGLNAFTESPLRVLDFGCGDAAMTARLAGSLAAGRGGMVFAVDGAVDNLESSAARVGRLGLKDVVFVLSLQGLPFAPETLDRVFGTLALGSQQSEVDVLAELARVLQPGGELLLAVVESEALWARMLRPVRRPLSRVLQSSWYSPRESESFLREAGFSLLERTQIEGMSLLRARREV